MQNGDFGADPGKFTFMIDEINIWNYIYRKKNIAIRFSVNIYKIMQFIIENIFIKNVVTDIFMKRNMIKTVLFGKSIITW